MQGLRSRLLEATSAFDSDVTALVAEFSRSRATPAAAQPPTSEQGSPAPEADAEQSNTSTCDLF